MLLVLLAVELPAKSLVKYVCNGANFENFFVFSSFALAKRRAKGFGWYYWPWLPVRWYTCWYGLMILGSGLSDLEKNKNHESNYETPLIYI